jgi:hypothetical protein
MRSSRRRNGFAVTLADAQREIAERGRCDRHQLAKLVDKQKVTAADRDQIGASRRPTCTAAT